MRPSLYDAHQFLVLLAELRNVALESELVHHRAPLFDEIPLDLLLRFYHLSAQATLAAVKAVDAGTSIEALVPLVSRMRPVVFVGDHRVFIPGIIYDTKRKSVAFVRDDKNNSNNSNSNSCSCPAFAYGDRQFCKHIFAAGFSIALAISPVRHVSASEILRRINNNNNSNSNRIQTATQPHKQAGVTRAESQPSMAMPTSNDPFAGFVPYDDDF